MLARGVREGTYPVQITVIFWKKGAMAEIPALKNSEGNEISQEEIMKLKSWSTFFQGKHFEGKVEFRSHGSTPQCVSIPSISMNPRS